MTWHDCKTDQPKEDGYYILILKEDHYITWTRAFQNTKWDLWIDVFDEAYEGLYKWAEVDLSEVE